MGFVPIREPGGARYDTISESGRAE
jgi:hypothetical protein